MRTRQLFRLTATARSFVFFAIGAPVLWERDLTALMALVVIGVIWLVAQLATLRVGRRLLASTSEAALIGVVCALALNSTPAVLAALSVPPFVVGLQRGIQGVAYSVSAELSAVVAIAFVVWGDLSEEASLGIFTWVVTGIGVGFVATFVRSTLLQTLDPLAPYLYAQGLIKQLIDLSGGLSSGLDVNSMGGAILSSVGDRIPTAALALYVPRGETIVALITASSDSERSFVEAEALATETWTTGETTIEGRSFAFALGDTAVIAGTLSDRVDLDLAAKIRLVTRGLDSQAVQFDTAVLFADFRDSASADERRRLAREMHDGVAQDIASLGYLVDALAARPASPAQAEQLAALRKQITFVVAEVRQSVLTLRTSLGESESLGAAIGTVARHLSEVSGIPITVTLDEHTTRLRPAVEAELFRIAQEAMNNAVKHARATTIDVMCRVYAPTALITVSDNGRGLQRGRSDSYGLEIMQERAQLIHADLTIADNAQGGVTVSVHRGSDDGHLTASSGGSGTTPERAHA